MQFSPMDVNSHWGYKKSQTKLGKQKLYQVHHQMILEMFQLRAASFVTVRNRLEPADQQNATNAYCCGDY
jgi:hypothetical protein